MPEAVALSMEVLGEPHHPISLLCGTGARCSRCEHAHLVACFLASRARRRGAGGHPALGVPGIDAVLQEKGPPGGHVCVAGFPQPQRAARRPRHGERRRGVLRRWRAAGRSD